MKFRINEKRQNTTVEFKKILPNIISQYGLEKSFTIEIIKSLWYDIVSDIISTHSIPERLSRGILYITADHSVYANEISLMKDRLIQDINNNLPQGTVEDIRIEIKSIKWK